ncbi:MAG: hypothetical protein KatS3mg065_0879 [Chloroflexota bacterium]|nr:MAG: hypothetical protein KatS3mg065_0879 [Chloroflexota bacterium]
MFLPFQLLPWDVFRLLWLGLQVGALWIMLRGWTLAAVAMYPVALELAFGNTNLLLALAIYAGLRYAMAWAWVLLTKLTPGIGLLWFAVRGEWRALALALGSTLSIAFVSWLVRPDLWAQWVAMLWANAQLGVEPGALYVPIPLGLRLPVAALLVLWGGRRDDPRWLGLACTKALPTLWPSGLSMLVLLAVPPHRWPRSGTPAPSALRPSLRLRRDP